MHVDCDRSIPFSLQKGSRNSVAEENNANAVKNYRPVSNLCFVSKIVEKVVAVRFLKHLSDNDLYEQMQFANRPNHSTETALLRVRDDLLYT